MLPVLEVMPIVWCGIPDCCTRDFRALCTEHPALGLGWKRSSWKRDTGSAIYFLNSYLSSISNTFAGIGIVPFPKVTRIFSILVSCSVYYSGFLQCVSKIWVVNFNNGCFSAWNLSALRDASMWLIPGNRKIPKPWYKCLTRAATRIENKYLSLYLSEPNSSKSDSFQFQFLICS